MLESRKDRSEENHMASTVLCRFRGSNSEKKRVDEATGDRLWKALSTPTRLRYIRGDFSGDKAPRQLPAASDSLQLLLASLFFFSFLPSSLLFKAASALAWQDAARSSLLALDKVKLNLPQQSASRHGAATFHYRHLSLALSLFCSSIVLSVLWKIESLIRQTSITQRNKCRTC